MRRLLVEDDALRGRAVQGPPGAGRRAAAPAGAQEGAQKGAGA